MAGPLELDADAPDLAAWIRPGAAVVWGQACAEPVILVDALLQRPPARASAFVGLSWRELLVPDGMRVVSYGALGGLGRLAALEVVPCHYSALPRLFAERRLPGDVVLVQVAPPDRHGRCSLGVGVDYLADALRHARAVEIDLTAQINAESAGGRRIGAVGGQVDFLRGAAQGGGKPIIALPARCIVDRLSGPVSTARSDVDWVVTEHGARSLAGLSDERRRTALLELAGSARAAELHEGVGAQ